MSLIKFSANDDLMYYICSLETICDEFENLKLISNENDVTILATTFEISTPFLMDSEAKKLQLQISGSEDAVFNINNKRLYGEYFFQKNQKKIRCILPLEEQNNISYIKKKFLEIQNSSQYNKCFKFSPSLKDISDNNKNSRIARDLFLNATDNNMHLHKFDGMNHSSEFCIHEYYNHKYMIPPNSRYINGDVLTLESLLGGGKFDLVVLDPPWCNKHIRRKKKAKGLFHGYKMMSVEEIMKIPLPSVLSSDAYVLIWVTNSSKILGEVLRSLKLWNLELITTWYWLKVTKAGEPVVSLDATSNGKLPYEKLLITSKSSKNHQFPSQLKNLVFCSIPCSVHSHKPPLNRLLEITLNINENWKCLELFARSLTTNWTSMGNEVLKFQDLVLLQKYEEET